MDENIMNGIITEGQSIQRPPYLDGTNYNRWKERMRTFIQSVDFRLWLVIKNGPNVPKKIIDGIEVEKPENEFDYEDMKNMELEAKAKSILFCALNPEAFEQISRCNTAKQIWDELEREMETPTADSTTPAAQVNAASAGYNYPNFEFLAETRNAMDSRAPEPQVVVPILDSRAPEPQVTIHNSTAPEPQVVVPILDSLEPPTEKEQSPYNSPILDFLQDTREAMNDFLKLCVPLHKLALEGNWPAAKRILDKDERLKHAAIARGWPTVLHVAAGTNHVHFVQELLKLLDNDHIALQDRKDNTAFCFAAAAGNLQIVELLLKRKPELPTIRGGNGMTPIQFAALQGRCEMTWYLYNKTKEVFEDRDWDLLFFACINTHNYHLALKMAQERERLASAHDDNGETGLHLLAKMPLDPCCKGHEHQIPIKVNPGMKQHVFLQLVSFLWNTILRNEVSKSRISKFISEPSHLLFDAAKAGNVGFLSELISAYPNLIWEADSSGRSIIHIAVLYRHASIFNLIHEIGALKDIIVTYGNDDDKNTSLHLAAKLAPPSQLELVSGAAFQMCLELLWFEEVKKIMTPSFIKLQNSECLTARELFTKEHAELRKNAESWMKSTAESCMLISTVIAAGVFSAAISIPGGIDDESRKPNYLDKSSFLVFAITDATALISSSTAILIFLSILVSRYAEYDFYKSLPLKLIFGLIALFISITSMMIAFGSAFFITYFYGSKWVPSFIMVLACLPILLFVFLQFSLWSEIIYSTYYCRTLFKPGKKMLYVLDK